MSFLISVKKKKRWHLIFYSFLFRFAKIQEPLVRRREQLEKVKFIHQFVRDVEDEKLWIEEKMPQATSSNVGNSLLSVQLLEKKNQVCNVVLKCYGYR